MIIINCANCAAELPHDNTGCVRYLFEESPAACARCQTRYCDATCRRAHWDGGGHRDVCSEIARAGGAEHAGEREGVDVMLDGAIELREGGQPRGEALQLVEALRGLDDRGEDVVSDERVLCVGGGSG